MGSSSSLAKEISFVASIVYFLFILLQIPLFRLQCRCGICSSPIQLTCSQLTAYKILPTNVAESILYPGDFANLVFTKTRLSEYNSGFVQKCNKISEKKRLHSTMNYDILHLEIMVGSYLCVSGAFLGLLKRGRLSLFGMLLLLWGLNKEAIYATSNNGVKICLVPMTFALLMACLSVRRDMKRIIRSFPGGYKKSRAKRCSKTKQV